MYRYWLPLGGVFVVAAGLLLHRAAHLRVQYARFDPAPQMDGAPSTTLNVGLSNEGGDDLTQIVVRVSILAEPAAISGVNDQLAGPYALVGRDSSYILGRH